MIEIEKRIKFYRAIIGSLSRNEKNTINSISNVNSALLPIFRDIAKDLEISTERLDSFFPEPPYITEWSSITIAYCWFDFLFKRMNNLVEEELMETFLGLVYNSLDSLYGRFLS